MGYIIVSLVFFIVGAITMFLVYRNNLKWFRAREEQLRGLPDSVRELLKKYGVDA